MLRFRLILLTTALGLAFACAPDFEREERVKDLRILGMATDPADIVFPLPVGCGVPDLTGANANPAKLQSCLPQILASAAAQLVAQPVNLHVLLADPTRAGAPFSWKLRACAAITEFGRCDRDPIVDVAQGQGVFPIGAAPGAQDQAGLAEGTVLRIPLDLATLLGGLFAAGGAGADGDPELDGSIDPGNLTDSEFSALFLYGGIGILFELTIDAGSGPHPVVVGSRGFAIVPEDPACAGESLSYCRRPNPNPSVTDFRARLLADDEKDDDDDNPPADGPPWSADTIFEVPFGGRLWMGPTRVQNDDCRLRSPYVLRCYDPDNCPADESKRLPNNPSRQIVNCPAALGVDSLPVGFAEVEESRYAAYYATAGGFSDTRPGFNRTSPFAEKTAAGHLQSAWKAPEAADAPPDGRVLLWVAMYDGRGGVAYTVRRIQLVPATAPASR